MLEQFQKILLTPKLNEETCMKKVQDTMLNTLENMMPLQFDFSELAKIYQNQDKDETVATLTLKLTEYFIKIITQNFISTQAYQALQQQTQKLESTIRSHIKMQQQMKMYLEHLQYKIERYDFHLTKLRRAKNLNQEDIKIGDSRQKENLQVLKKRQTSLLKERLVLLKKVEHLERKLKDQQVQLKRLNSPISPTIQLIKQQFLAWQLKQCSPEMIAKKRTETQKFVSEGRSMNDKGQRLSMYSKTSDHQITQKRPSMGNGSQSYRANNSITQTQKQVISDLAQLF